MVLKQLSEMDYSFLYTYLNEKAYCQPLEACYTVRAKVNSVEYDIRMQLEDDLKVAILQAYKIDREELGPCFELVTENYVLSSLFDILRYQFFR